MLWIRRLIIFCFLISASNSLTDMTDVNKGVGVHYDYTWTDNTRRVSGYCVNASGSRLGAYYALDFHDYVTAYYEMNSPPSGRDSSSASRWEKYTLQPCGEWRF